MSMLPHRPCRYGCCRFDPAQLRRCPHQMYSAGQGLTPNRCGFTGPQDCRRRNMSNSRCGVSPRVSRTLSRRGRPHGRTGARTEKHHAMLSLAWYSSQILPVAKMWSNYGRPDAYATKPPIRQRFATSGGNCTREMTCFLYRGIPHAQRGEIPDADVGVPMRSFSDGENQKWSTCSIQAEMGRL